MCIYSTDIYAIYTQLYIYIHNLYTHIYMCMRICVCVYIHTDIYTTEVERRERLFKDLAHVIVEAEKDEI